MLPSARTKTTLLRHRLTNETFCNFGKHKKIVLKQNLIFLTNYIFLYILSPVLFEQIRKILPDSYKKTVVFDPTTSATFKALHEDEVVEDAEPVQQKVFRPNRMVPAKVSYFHFCSLL